MQNMHSHRLQTTHGKPAHFVDHYKRKISILQLQMAKDWLCLCFSPGRFVSTIYMHHIIRTLLADEMK
jgi:hypothetical protein